MDRRWLQEFRERRFNCTVSRDTSKQTLGETDVRSTIRSATHWTCPSGLVALAVNFPASSRNTSPTLSECTPSGLVEITKSGELVILTPSLYHATSGGGFPLTLATNLADPPSRMRCEWSFSVNCGATPTTARNKPTRVGSSKRNDDDS